MPLLGYLSFEWLFISAMLLIVAWVGHEFTDMILTDYQLLKSIILGFVAYCFLFLGGKTPEGIALPSSAAGRGHPILSLFVAVSVSLIMLSGPVRLTGEYKVVDLEKSVSGLTALPKDSKTTLADYKNLFIIKYKDQTLVISDDNTSEALLSAGYDGVVEGLFTGSWKAGEEEGKIFIYRWVSGLDYLKWGEASVDDGALKVHLKEDGMTLVLYFEKTD